MSIQIFVKKLNGERIILDVETSDTIKIVMAKIQDKEESLPDQPHLVFKGTLLEEDLQLVDYNVVAGSTLDLTIPPTQEELQNISDLARIKYEARLGEESNETSGTVGGGAKAGDGDDLTRKRPSLTDVEMKVTSTKAENGHEEELKKIHAEYKMVIEDLKDKELDLHRKMGDIRGKLEESERREKDLGSQIQAMKESMKDPSDRDLEKLVVESPTNPGSLFKKYLHLGAEKAVGSFGSISGTVPFAILILCLSLWFGVKFPQFSAS